MAIYGFTQLTDCQVTDNRGKIGGGSYVGETGSLTLQDSVVRNNIAAFGGGIAVQGVLTTYRISMIGNEAFVGGGVYNDGICTLTQTTISNNVARASKFVFVGGGLFNIGTATFRNQTIVRDNRLESN